jgi:hypothetical protein
VGEVSTALKIVLAIGSAGTDWHGMLDGSVPEVVCLTSVSTGVQLERLPHWEIGDLPAAPRHPVREKGWLVGEVAPAAKTHHLPPRRLVSGTPSCRETALAKSEGRGEAELAKPRFSQFPDFVGACIAPAALLKYPHRRLAIVASGCLSPRRVLNRSAREGDSVSLDSVGAGDSFNGGLATALARGDALTEAVRFAAACGALATTAHGGAASAPTLAAVLNLTGEAGRR